MHVSLLSVTNAVMSSDPVFFASHCGKKDIFLSSPSPFTLEDEDDGRFCSLGEAVEFARINNLLGVIVDADLLVRHCVS